MPGDKENQEISVVGRLLSLEALVFLMGLVSLVYGLLTASLWTAVTGGAVIACLTLFWYGSRR